MSSTPLGSARPPFLILTPACILVGIAASVWLGHSIPVWQSLLILLCALSAHVSVNAFNEYQDFESGLDLITERTAFSGGSGTLPANPALLPGVRWLAFGSLLITICTGVYLATPVWQAALPLGFIGLLTILLYTPVLNRSPLLCLIAPGLAFGPLYIIGTVLVLTGEISTAALLASLPVFCVINNLLLLNQYPDIEADRQSGRRHAPIHYGVKFCNGIYLGFVLLAYGSLVTAVMMGGLPVMSLLAMLAMPLALLAWRGAEKSGAGIGSTPQYLAMNVICAISTPALLGIGLLLA